ncbi:hypothetical protein UlMin_006970 [Ulmus minor]
MAITQTILTQDLVDELVLINAKSDKLLRLKWLVAFVHIIPRTKIIMSIDYAVTVGSDLCIVTAGVHQNPDESHFNLLHRNVLLFHNTISPFARFFPDTVLLIIYNPLSGFPSNRVIMSGTNLDSSRFRSLIANHLDACIVGEHGDSSVALWSSISVGGVSVLSFLEKHQIAYEKETLEKIHSAVIESAYKVISLKGYTSWEIGYYVANIARSILRERDAGEDSQGCYRGCLRSYKPKRLHLVGNWLLCG